MSLSVSLIVLGVFGSAYSIVYNRTGSGLNAVPGDIPDGANQVLLRGNRIRTLREGDFTNLTSCTRIDLEDNFISEIESGTFDGLTLLSALDLDVNGLTELKKYMFQDLRNLVFLDFNSNMIRSIEDDTFATLSSLRILKLAHNVLTELKAAMFHGLRSIEVITLDQNKLTSIDSSTFSDLPRPLELALDFNPLVCDDSFCWLKEEEKQGKITWLIWNEHLYKPSCNEDVVWNTWECSEGWLNFHMGFVYFLQ